MHKQIYVFVRDTEEKPEASVWPIDFIDVDDDVRDILAAAGINTIGELARNF